MPNHLLHERRARSLILTVTTDVPSGRLEVDLYGDTLLQACEFSIAIILWFQLASISTGYLIASGINYMSISARLSIH